MALYKCCIIIIINAMACVSKYRRLHRTSCTTARSCCCFVFYDMAGNLKRVDEMMILSYSVSLYGLVFFSPNDLYQAQNVTIFGISGKYCDYSKKTQNIERNG